MSLGLLFLTVLTLDMSAAVLWLVGTKEQSRNLFKRHPRQRWYAHRLWDIANVLRVLLFYAALAAFIRA